MRALLLLPTNSGLLPVRVDPGSDTLDQDLARLARLAEPPPPSMPDLITSQVRDLNAMRDALETALSGGSEPANSSKSVA